MQESLSVIHWRCDQSLLYQSSRIVDDAATGSIKSTVLHTNSVESWIV